MDLQELESIAREEMLKHGLHNWTFALANTKRRLGVCKFQSRRIEISEYYALNSPKSLVLDTLLHEIAHALAGPKANHGPAWKTVAIRIGAIPRACKASSEIVVAPGEWQATCAACNKTFHRYKRPMSLGGYRCRCSARTPLTFAFMGDPAVMPATPLTLEETAKWEAKCVGCDTVHLRVRRPKFGIWRCKCPHKCELTWRYRRGSA